MPSPTGADRPDTIPTNINNSSTVHSSVEKRMMAKNKVDGNNAAFLPTILRFFSHDESFIFLLGLCFFFFTWFLILTARCKRQKSLYKTDGRLYQRV